MLTLQFRFEMAMASKNLAQLILTLADYVNWPQIAEKSAVDLAKWQLKNINVKPDQRRYMVACQLLIFVHTIYFSVS